MLMAEQQPFPNSIHCAARVHCIACRQGTFGSFDCPFSVTAETAETIQIEALKKLGAQPAVKAKPCGTPCGAKAAHKENLELETPAKPLYEMMFPQLRVDTGK